MSEWRAISVKLNCIICTAVLGEGSETVGKWYYLCKYELVLRLVVDHGSLSPQIVLLLDFYLIYTYCT